MMLLDPRLDLLGDDLVVCGRFELCAEVDEREAKRIRRVSRRKNEGARRTQDMCAFIKRDECTDACRAALL